MPVAMDVVSELPPVILIRLILGHVVFYQGNSVRTSQQIEVNAWVICAEIGHLLVQRVKKVKALL